MMRLALPIFQKCTRSFKENKIYLRCGRSPKDYLLFFWDSGASELPETFRVEEKGEAGAEARSLSRPDLTFG